MRPKYNLLILIAIASVSNTALAAVKKHVRPQASFKMSPLVVTVSARPGQEVPFEINIEANQKDIELSVAPTGITQLPSGLIMPEETKPPMGEIVLRGRKSFRLRKGETHILRGTWRIPSHTSGFVANGLLVTEQQADLPLPKPGNGRQAASVRFVTRYLLRLEAIVSSGRAATIPPAIHSPQLIERGGRAWVVAKLQSPIEGTGTLRVKAQAQIIDSEGKPVATPFALRLPVRDNQPMPSREQIPLLAGSIVNIHAEVPEPLFAGDYQLVVTAGDRARHVSQKAIESVTVKENQFPAQENLVAEVVRNVELSPTQLKLSVARGGNRLIPLEIKNRSAESIKVALQPKSFGDSPADWLIVRPDKFELPAGRARKVLVSVRGGKLKAENSYARLFTAVSSAETASRGTRSLPVALIGHAASQKPTLWIGKAEWKRHHDEAAIVVPLNNIGSVHAAPHVKLRLVDDLDREIALEAGFENWLLPGESRRLSFLLESLPRGDYLLYFEVYPALNAEPDYHEQVIEVSG